MAAAAAASLKDPGRDSPSLEVNPLAILFRHCQCPEIRRCVILCPFGDNDVKVRYGRLLISLSEHVWPRNWAIGDGLNGSPSIVPR
jgi:hypothetical protein